MTKRVVTALLFILSALLSAQAASAQEAPLPVPSADPRVVFIPLYPTILSPSSGETLWPGTIFKWADAGSSTYTMKFKVVETRQVFKYDVGAPCPDTECALYVPPTVMAQIKDGHTVKFSIIANFPNSTIKSQKITLTVDEGPAATLTSPADGAVFVNRFDFDGFRWNHTFFANQYRVIVRNAAGEKVIDYTDSSWDFCNMATQTCGLGMNPQLHNHIVLQEEHTWQVIAITETEPAIKSEKRRFTILYN
ncbi:MAG: hypothetical protein IPM16_18740 [Chloroflexi bacterium]|nr:hypothetical protein [Chloroflexota bacterium]